MTIALHKLNTLSNLLEMKYNLTQDSYRSHTKRSMLKLSTITKSICIVNETNTMTVTIFQFSIAFDVLAVIQVFRVMH